MPHAWETEYADEINALNLRYELNQENNTLSFSNVDIDDMKANLIAKILPHISSLKFNRCVLHSDSVKTLMEAINDNPSVTALELRDQEQNEEVWKALFEALKSNNNITSLGLSGNKIGRQSEDVLSDTFKVNTTVKFIDLSHNMIFSENIERIINALGINKSIDLSYNFIFDSGAEIIAEMLKRDISLISLNIKYNHIHSEKMQEIAEALRFNSHLESCEVSASYMETTEMGIIKLPEEYKNDKAQSDIDIQTNTNIKIKNIINQNDNNQGLKTTLELRELIQLLREKMVIKNF